MLSYVYFGTNDLKKATEFYDAVLGVLGMQRCVTQQIHRRGVWQQLSLTADNYTGSQYNCCFRSETKASAEASVKSRVCSGPGNFLAPTSST